MSDDWEYMTPPPDFVIWRQPRPISERRQNPNREAFHEGMKVVVTGPFPGRTGTGRIRKIARHGQGGLIVELDTGQDVLIERRHAQPAMPH